MTTRKSTHKKHNRFDELGNSVHDTKDTDLLEEPSSITEVSDTISDQYLDLKESRFTAFQERTINQFGKIETSFINITDSLNSLHHSLAVLYSRQNPSNKYSPKNNNHTTHQSYGHPTHNNENLEDDTPFASSNNNDQYHDHTDDEVSTNGRHTRLITIILVAQSPRLLHIVFGRLSATITLNPIGSSLSSKESSYKMIFCIAYTISTTRLGMLCTPQFKKTY